MKLLAPDTRKRLDLDIGDAHPWPPGDAHGRMMTKVWKADLVELLHQGATRQSADERVRTARQRVDSGEGESRPLLRVYHDHAGGKRIPTTRRTQSKLQLADALKLRIPRRQARAGPRARAARPRARAGGDPRAAARADSRRDRGTTRDVRHVPAQAARRPVQGAL